MFPTSGQLQPVWHLAVLDQAVDLPRAARVQGDVALTDARFLREQARGEQRLADFERERRLVAVEAARQVGELGVVAAPLAHAVEPLEDAARDAAGGVGVVVGDRDALVLGWLPEGPQV